VISDNGPMLSMWPGAGIPDSKTNAAGTWREEGGAATVSKPHDQLRPNPTRKGNNPRYSGTASHPEFGASLNFGRWRRPCRQKFGDIIFDDFIESCASAFASKVIAFLPSMKHRSGRRFRRAAGKPDIGMFRFARPR